MKTYMILYHSSEGADPTKVRDRLLSLGFKAIQGNYDYVYEWDRDVDVEETIRLGDRIRKALEGTNVIFKMETI
jgi:hypothetical protein